MSKTTLKMQQTMMRKQSLKLSTRKEKTAYDPSTYIHELNIPAHQIVM